ncbi:MAG: Crp/Fnr family transcriptional regulator [Bryobacteraceae bacterium]
MAPAEIRNALATHPFLEGLPEKYLDVLAKLAFEVSFGQDEIIFREGDPSSLFYLILSGKIALEIASPGRHVIIQTLEAGDELGWSSLLENTSKQFRARCLEPVRALAFDGARVVALCEEDHEFGYHIMRRALELVAERLRATRIQVLDVYSPKGVRGQ